MALLVYVRHPDDTSMLIDELSDLEESMSLCRDLVAVDGYERAEVWEEDGERLYAVVREGAAVRTLASLELPASLPARPEPAPHPLADVPPAEPGRADESAPAHPPSPPAPPSPDGVRILGERPGHEERWLGL